MTTAQLPLAGDPGRPVRPVAHPGTAPGYDAFVVQHRSRLRRLVERRLGDPGEAEEITQETLLRAHAHWDELPDEDAAAAWTTVVAKRLVVDRLRVRGRWVPVPEISEGASVGRDTADIVVAKAEARSALEALEALPARQASVVWAREVEGLSYDEIGERHGLTEPTVRSLLSRGRKALRREYALRGGELPLGAVVPLAPVLEALRALGRLRRAAVAGGAATTAGLGLVVAAVLGGTLPGGGDSLDGSPATTPVVQDLGSTAPAVVDRPAEPTADAPAQVPAAVRPTDVAPVPAAAAPAPRRLTSVLPDTCTTGRRTAVGACLTDDVDTSGGITLRVPVVDDEAQLQSGVVRDCPPLTTRLCTPGTRPSSSPSSDTASSPAAPQPALPSLRRTQETSR